MLLLVILLPFFGFVGGSLFGRFIGRNGAAFVTTFFTFVSFNCSWFLLSLALKNGETQILKLNSWVVVDNFNLYWSFCGDSLTVIMLCIITCISSFVHLYSCDYMSQDPHLTRFMSYLSLFTFFMLILVTANNFIQMFVGWEGVGVSSYLLINFWFTRIQANKAAIKAMLVNRIGDFFLLFAILTIYFLFNSLDYDIVFSLVPLFTKTYLIFLGTFIPVLDFICILLFLGAMGKSAQLGLHTWLPDAMEGPTPVSALIHAATMVTAGVFLIARCSYLFEFSQMSLNFITIIGACTAFFAATTGLFQNDIKKIIAYSTCSQLGYMIFACGLSSYDVGLFHLSNHAFFKALLFLGAGSVIHALADEQDLRKMGGLKQLLPFSYSIMLIGSLALIGFPFLAGFYSKDVILEVSFAKYSIAGHFSFLLGVLAAFCTAFYSTRLLFLTFLANSNSNKVIINKAHEGSWQLTTPLVFLSFCSIFIAFLSKDIFIGFGTDFWGAAIFINPFHYNHLDIEFLTIKYKLLPFFITILGVLTAFFLYSGFMKTYYKIKAFKIYNILYHFFNKKWFFDRLYTQLFNQVAVKLSFNFFYKEIDRGLLEAVGPSGVVFFIVKAMTWIVSKPKTDIINLLKYFIFGFSLLFLFSFFVFI